MKTFVLPCTSNNPDYDAECDVAIVVLDAERLRRIRERLVRVKEARKADPQLWEIYFWDDSLINFYELSLDPFDDDETGLQAMEDGQGYLVSGTKPAPRVKGDAQRVECVQMIVDGDGHVRWTCIPKRSHIYITTENLPL